MKIKKIINTNNYLDILSSTNTISMYVKNVKDAGEETIILKTDKNKLISLF